MEGKMGISAISSAAIRATPFVAKPKNVVDVRMNVNSLHDVFTQHLISEAESNGSVAIIAQGMGTRGACLAVSDAKGNVRNVTDPLGLAQHMKKKGLERITLELKGAPYIRWNCLDKVFLALLSNGGFTKVSGVEVFQLDDFFVDDAIKGLPVMDNITYSFNEKLIRGSIPVQKLSLDAFVNRLRRYHDTDELKAYYLQNCLGDNRDEFINAVMGVIKELLSSRDGFDAALTICKGLYELDISDNTNIWIIKVMMKNASIFIERNIDRSLKIWRTLYENNFDISNRFPGEADQKTITVLTMMDLASKQFSVDPQKACKIWGAVYDLEQSRGQHLLVVKTMCFTASEIFTRDIDAALTILRSVVTFTGIPEDVVSRIVSQTMIDSMLLIPENTESAVKFLKFLYEVDLQPVRRVDIITALFNKASQIMNFRPNEAVRLLEAVLELEPTSDNQLNALSIMYEISELPDNKETYFSYALWTEMLKLNVPEREKFKVIATIFNRAYSSEEERKLLYKYFANTVSGLDPDTYLRIMSGLTYFNHDYEGVIKMIDESGTDNPAVLGLKADALRKMWRHDEAIALCSAIIERCSAMVAPGFNDSQSLLTAYCCRGYSLIEKSRITAPEKQATIRGNAISDFEHAIKAAEKFDFPIPPRAYSGIAFAYKLAGNVQKAQEFYKKAIELDSDNEKANRALLSINNWNGINDGGANLNGSNGHS